MDRAECGLWHGWNGGVCPIHPDSEISVCLLNGLTHHEVTAKSVAPSHWAEGIAVAFRVTKPYREPREFWVTKCGGYTHAHDSAEAAQTYAKANENLGVAIIHVREVRP